MKLKDIQTEINGAISYLKNKRIIILCGGFSEERQASLYTAKQVNKELLKHGFIVKIYDPTKNNIFNVFNPRKDIIFNCLHGSFGESGHLSGILDYLHIPYTFSGLYASAVCMDKLLFKAAATKIGLACVQDCFDADFYKDKIHGLFMHKKRKGGGSIGAHVNYKKKTTKYGYFTETFIDGKILTLGILEKNSHFLPLDIVHIHLHKKIFYDTVSKYKDGNVSYTQYNEKTGDLIKKQAVQLSAFLGISGCARIDLIEKDGVPYFLEINTVPGLYEESNLVISAKFFGLSFFELLIWILKNAKYNPLL